MIDDLENGWLENTPDAAWNLTEDVPEWLEEFRIVFENLGIEHDDPTTRAEAERELRDMARDVLSGLMAIGSLPVYVVMTEDYDEVDIHGIFLHQSVAECCARDMTHAPSAKYCFVEEHEVM